MKRTQWRPWLPIVAHGESLVSHAGGVLLAQTARACGLERDLHERLRPWRRRRAVHDPAKVLLDLAITVALGGDCAADIALLRAHPDVFGPGAPLTRPSPASSMIWRNWSGRLQGLIVSVR